MAAQMAISVFCRSFYTWICSYDEEKPSKKQSTELETGGGELPEEVEATFCHKWKYMKNYLPANHSCLSLYWRSSNDEFTRCQRRQLCLWMIILVLLQNVTSYWLLHAWGQTQDWIDICYDHCKQANPVDCVKMNLGQVKLDDTFTFNLATFGNTDYFVYERPPSTQNNGTDLARFQSCEFKTIAVHGNATVRTHCQDGCFRDGEYTVTSCNTRSIDNVGLLCRHPDSLPEWKRHMWYYFMLPVFFYVVLFPIRDVYLRMCLPCLNIRRKRWCKLLCNCFLYPQLAVIFAATLGLLGLTILLCWATYRDTNDVSNEEAMQVVMATLAIACMLGFVYEFIALFLDFWMCNRWKDDVRNKTSMEKSVFFYFNSKTPMRWVSDSEDGIKRAPDENV